MHPQKFGLHHHSRCPRSPKTGRSEGAEETSSRALALDNHQILLLSLELVHLNRLEEVVCGVGQNLGERRPEAAGEVSNRHA